MIVQLRRPEKIWASHLRVVPIARGKKFLFTLIAASSPLKQATGTEIQPVKPAGRIVPPAN